VKARLVMMHTSRDSLGASMLALIVVGICCRVAWRMGGAIVEGISASGMLDAHLVCLLARSRP
jgi:hypothetical protein